MERDRFEIQNLVPCDAPIDGAHRRFICIAACCDGSQKTYAITNMYVDENGELLPSSGDTYIPDSVANDFMVAFFRLAGNPTRSDKRSDSLA